MPKPSEITPPKAKPVQYKAPLGTRWEKEKANVPRGTFEYVTDPNQIGPWVLGECVGKGASGRVKVARHCQTGQLAAVKILPLETVISSRLSMRSRENKAEKHRNGIDKEIIMMKLMDHPNIVRIFDVFEGEKELFLVLEYVDGGELFDYLVNHGRMEPLKGLCYFKQIIYGLSYAHAFSIIHRDLKPENILIASLNPPHVKIADWGMAAFAPPEHHLETSCGSPHYASPEIVRGEPYSGTATDIWSCGVILFALMTGRLPFDDKNIRALLQKVKSGKFEIPSYVFPEATDLLRRMLVVDVEKRITMSDLLNHPFLRHTTAGVTYVPAPTLSELDRPLRSRALIKQDLLSSLLHICAGLSYDEVVSDLLSQPGQGSLIKAMYFLLAKHRERSLEEYGMQNVITEDDGQKIRHYAAPPLKNKPGSSAISIETPSTGSTVGPSLIRASRLAPAPPSQIVPEPSSPGRSRPPSPVGPRSPRISHQKGRPSSSPFPSVIQTPTPSNASTDVNMLSPVVDATQADTSRRTPVRPMRSRTQTVDGLPVQQRFDPGYSPTDVFAPRSPRPAYNSPIADIVSPRMAMQAPSLPPLDVGTDVPWLVKPTVGNPELQRAIDDIAGRFSVLVSRENQGSQSPGGNTADMRSSRVVNEEHFSPKKLRLMPKKTSQEQQQTLRDFRYSHPNAKVINLTSVIENAEDVHGKENRNTNGSYTSFSSSAASGEDDSYMKIDMGCDLGSPKVVRTKVKKNRETIQPVRAQPPDEPPHIRRSMTDPPAPPAVVGEVKGWFANLFHWKAQQYILHSVDNCLTTRDEVARLMQIFGCQVSLEEAQGWGVLRCRMDETYDPNTGSVLMKSVRFRVEFSPILGYIHRDAVPATATPTANGNAGGSSNSVVVANPARLSAKNMTPFASMLVLVQEKGALSTFKYVYQRLRAEWRLDALRSPEIGSATPLIGATPRLR